MPEVLSRLGRLVNSALRPVGLGLHRLEVSNRVRRATQAGAFEQLKRLGFDPRTVIDVGVAHGTPALYQTFPDARHLLIEPVEECTPFLEAIARQFRQVEYILAAAARHPTPPEPAANTRRPTHASRLQRPAAAAAAPATPPEEGRGA